MREPTRSFAVVAVAVAAALGAIQAVPGPALAGPVAPGAVTGAGAVAPAPQGPPRVSGLADAIRERVFVRSEMDSDGDGRLDRIAVGLIRPAETGQGVRVASIVRATPYHAISNNRVRGLMIPGPQGEPAHFGTWFDEYFVPRGYAVVEVDMQGTNGSEGCATTGGPEDTLSAKAAIDWLNGRTTAEYPDGSPAVASWSTGNAGMIGTSYAGTLPIALAETGVVGLRTIVPIAAISSWYDYTRAQGIGYYSGFGLRYPEGLARIVSSPAAVERCDERYTRLGDQAGDDTYDYTPFYATRNFRDQTNRVGASVFLVHGQQDDNVKTTHFGKYWAELAANSVPRRLYLHDGAHSDPFDADLTERDAVGRWMDHWLYGAANGVMDEPQATIRRPDGTKQSYRQWPAAGTATTYHLGGPGMSTAGTLVGAAGSGSQQFTDNPRQEQSAMVSDPQTAKANRLVYLTSPLTTARRLSGTGRAQLTFSASTTSTPLSVLLVHYTNGQPTRVVARGAIDAKNRASLTTGTALVPGQRYTATVELEPKDYVFAAGSRIGLVVAANNSDYIATDRLAGAVTVLLGSSRLDLPLVTP
ncbi:MAG TPA: CocE/NonD family hydrolase [Catenuloplanes sp.]|jgi:X-Pro dipeptidyl-peptidase